MKEYRAEAKTIEAAIQEGLEELGLKRDQISYTVEQEPKSGFLGIGSKKAIVLIREKYRKNKTSGRFHKGKNDMRGNRRDFRKGGRRRPDAYMHGDDNYRRREYSNRDAYTQNDGDSTADYSHRTTRYGYEDARNPRPETPVFENHERHLRRRIRRERVYNEIALSPEYMNMPYIEDPVEHAKAVLVKLLELTGVNGAVVQEARLEEDGALVYLSFSCGDSSEFTQDNGRMLQSLQFMINTIINRKREPHLALRLDTAGYWDSKKEEISTAVERAVACVKASGNVYRLDPMPATMRKLVHTLVHEQYPEMKTTSEGEGRWRKVVIMPKTEEELASEKAAASEEQKPVDNLSEEVAVNEVPVSQENQTVEEPVAAPSEPVESETNTEEQK